SILKRVANVNEVDPIANLTAQVSALTSQIFALTTREAQSSKEPMGVIRTSPTCDETGNKDDA
ncbi:hypothetical protein TorRG33x02_147230, partial [Trema orientale]